MLYAKLGWPSGSREDDKNVKSFGWPRGSREDDENVSLQIVEQTRGRTTGDQKSSLSRALRSGELNPELNPEQCRLVTCIKRLLQKSVDYKNH